jgi:hypothetical protein
MFAPKSLNCRSIQQNGHFVRFQGDIWFRFFALIICMGASFNYNYKFSYNAQKLYFRIVHFKF